MQARSTSAIATLGLSLSTLLFLHAAPAAAERIVTGPVDVTYPETQECTVLNPGAFDIVSSARIRDAETGAVLLDGGAVVTPANATASLVLFPTLPLPQRVYCEVETSPANAPVRVTLVRRNFGNFVLETSEGAVVGDGTTGSGSLITQACAAVGCFPGDAPGLPVEILTPGHYRLGSNLVLPDAETSGVVVQNSDVWLDLGGYLIAGPVTCSATPLTCSPATSACVDAFNAERTTVENGNVLGCGTGIRMGFHGTIRGVKATSNAENGISALQGTRVSEVTAVRNGQTGVSVNLEGIIRNVNASDNGMDGISTTDGVIETCIAERNGRHGISADGTIRGNTVSSNGEFGIRAFSGSVVVENSAAGSSTTVGDVAIGAFNRSLVANNTVWSADIGLQLGDLSGFRSNVISQTSTASVQRVAAGEVVVDLGQNLCDGAACVVVDP